MKDKKIIVGYLLFALLQLFSLSSCSEDAVYDTAANNQEQILNLLIATGESKNTTRADDTRPGTDDENKIERLRVIIFERNETGQLLKQIKNEMFYAASNNESLLSLSNIRFEKTERIQVLLVANERTDWHLEDSDKSAAEIKNQTVVYGDAKEGYVTIGTPIVMFAQSEVLSGQSDQSIKVQMKRNLARVDLTLTCNASDISDLMDGELRLTSACIKQMAPQTNIEGGIHTGFKPEDCLVSTDIVYEQGKNYTIHSSNGVFSGFETDKISFYVPEHYVTNANTHTYIAIYGKYIPKGSSAEQGVPVEYFLPIGEGITKADYPDLTKLSIDDLTIVRNHLYEMKAQFKTLKKVSMVYVNVKPWEIKDVTGDIAQKKLNVSDLTPSIKSGESAKVQFWTDFTDVSQIRVLETGIIENTENTFEVNKVFVSLAGTVNKVDNFTFEGKTQWGRLHLIPQSTLSEDDYGKTYIITLAAGKLQRTINVKLTKAATQATDKQ